MLRYFNDEIIVPPITAIGTLVPVLYQRAYHRLQAMITGRVLQTPPPPEVSATPTIGISPVAMEMRRSHASAGPVVHVVAGGGLYGIERMLMNLLPELQERHDIELVCLIGPAGEDSDLGHACSRDVRVVHFVPMSSRLDVRGILRLRETLRQANPYIVHTHGYKATILAGALGLWNGTPTITTYHGEAFQAVGVSVYMRVETPILRRLPAIAAVSVPIRDELVRRGVARERIHFVPNGVRDPKRLSATSPPPAPVILIVGRLSPEKNIDVALRAVNQARAELPDLKLIIAGEGPERGRLCSLIAQLGLSEVVELLGYVHDVDVLMSRASCFLLPSQTEGMPLALLEAMACGLPIIASAVGAIPEVARRGSEAVLVSPGDPGALAQAIKRVLTDRGLAEALGRNARHRFAEHYTATVMADRYMALYQSVAPSLDPAHRARHS